MERDQVHPLSYEEPGASRGRHFWRCLAASCLLSIGSILVSVGWTDLRWAIPDSVARAPVNSRLDVKLHAIYLSRHINSLWDLLPLFVLPSLAAGALVIAYRYTPAQIEIASSTGKSENETAGGPNRQTVRTAKRWCLFFVILAWATPVIADIIFFWQFAFGRGPWVD
jgi:hypothetical protein